MSKKKVDPNDFTLKWNVFLLLNITYLLYILYYNISNRINQKNLFLFLC